MKFLPLLIPLVVAFLLGKFSRSSYSNPFSRDLPEVSITRCHDGDTCRTTEGERIRLACIDAPELKQPYGEASRDYLRSLLKNQTVRIDRRGSDRFGRTIALLYVPNGKEWRAVQEIQAEAGTVWEFDRFKKDCPIWGAIDREANAAQKNRRGLFADEKAIEPWEWRRRNR
jgi:micrococcal nuclease